MLGNPYKQARQMELKAELACAGTPYQSSTATAAVYEDAFSTKVKKVAFYLLQPFVIAKPGG